MDFLRPGLSDIIDIIIISFIVYRVLLIVKNTGSFQVLIGFAIVLVLYLASVFLELRMLSRGFEILKNYWFIAFIILFQSEIRNFIMKAGFDRDFKSIFHPRKKYIYSPILESVKSMAFRKTGALIVIENSQKLDKYVETGEIIDARLTSKLLITIFNKYTILHDGAVVVRNNRIHACKVLLPLSRNIEHVQKHGTRHLAAIGITEETDAFVIVVSEESGQVSTTKNGTIFHNVSQEELAQRIADETKR